LGKKNLLIGLLGLLLIITSCFAIYQSIPKKRISNVGTIRVIGVSIFEDANLTIVLQEIDWGIIGPNETKTHEGWILNDGNDNQKLLMWSNAWNPSNASDWITLSWSYNDEILQPNATLRVEFSLFVDLNISGIENFSFDIWITGVKVE